MKPCIKCGVIQPLSEFYVHSKMADGHLNKCKECTKAEARENRAARIDYYREYDRQRGNKPSRVEARKAYQATDHGRERGNVAKRAYMSRNADRRAVHVTFRNAVRDGRVVPLPCEICGDAKADGHHASYELPLGVTWLCRRHHSQLHREFRALMRAGAQ